MDRTRRWRMAFGQGMVFLLLAVAIGLGTNVLRTDRLPWVGDWSVKGQLAAIQEQTDEDPVITLDEARALFEMDAAVFLDARPEDFYAIGHIKGARSLPWEDFESRFPEVMADVSPDALLVTYCDGNSCGLSKDLALALFAKGFRSVRVLPDGWSSWKHAGLPMEGG